MWCGFAIHLIRTAVSTLGVDWKHSSSWPKAAMSLDLVTGIASHGPLARRTPASVAATSQRSIVPCFEKQQQTDGYVHERISRKNLAESVRSRRGPRSSASTAPVSGVEVPNQGDNRRVPAPLLACGSRLLAHDTARPSAGHPRAAFRG